MIAYPPELEELVEKLKKRKDVLAIYLFGSWAKGKARENSDIDVAVLLHPYSERAEDELSLIPKPFDVVVLNSVRNPILIYEALGKGKPLFVRDKKLFTRVAFPLAKRFIHALPLLRRFGVIKGGV